MIITTEQSLRDFKFWSGGKDRADKLTCEQLDEVESQLEDCYPEGMTDTQINDLFWFDFDTIKEWLGIIDIDEVEEWWKNLSDNDLEEISDIDREDYRDDEEGEIGYDEWYTRVDAWWNDMSDDEKIDIYKDNN